MASQSERRTATRQRLVEVARACFAAGGYECTSTEQIRQRAGVSRGAMYYHFPSKRAMFEAVFNQASKDAIQGALRSVGAGHSPLDDLIEACHAWLREVRHPDTAAILIDQGPRVLGARRARDLEAQTSLTLMTNALERAAQAGEIAVASIPLTARLLDALLGEAALAAVDRQSPASPADLEHALRQFVQGLAPIERRSQTGAAADSRAKRSPRA